MSTTETRFAVRLRPLLPMPHTGGATYDSCAAVADSGYHSERGGCMTRRRLMRTSRRRGVAALLAVGATGLAAYSASSSVASTPGLDRSALAHLAAAVYTGPKLHIPAGSNPRVAGKTVGVVILTS